ncbi:MAG: hypothetical protein IPP83_00030 [Flavobacteriales bacterium]|nr:hypothetical protein [Flavobacteriales bacterium]
MFDNDIIRNADIYTAGFNAQYGGRISSVMDITTRDGNRTRMSGRVGASTFAAKALLEGPIKKQKEPGDGSSSYLLNFRHSYLDQSSKTFYDNVNNGAGLPFTFTDAYGKVSPMDPTAASSTSSGSISDGVNYRGVSDLKWNNFGAGTSLRASAFG